MAIEHELCQSRPTQINYSAIESLQFLGHYTRKLPVSMSRMMENAYDWEHLPHVHSSSFAGIELIDKGSWGWRARTALPGIDSGFQLIDLLIDVEKNYWATTVFDGPGTGIQIHTQATEVDDQEIEIDVRFFSQNAIDQENADFACTLLRDQYTILYDEDIELMSGRQTALDRLLSQSDRTPQATEVLVDNA
ncbi:hypothetical protein N9063_01470, partial [Deltaproteobacteria bacterium]|nr:hypothetical protein [Deltaproteobacteria bacterium]